MGRGSRARASRSGSRVRPRRHRRATEWVCGTVRQLVVDRPIEHVGHIGPVAAQPRRSVSSIYRTGSWRRVCSPLRQAPRRGHVRLGPGFVDEDQFAGIKPALKLFPLFPPPRDLRPILLAGAQAFFEAMAGHAKKRPGRVRTHPVATLGQHHCQSPHLQMRAFLTPQQLHCCSSANTRRLQPFIGREPTLPVSRSR